MRIPIVLTIGLVLTALAVAVAASRSPLVLISAVSTPVEGGLTGLRSGSTVCQSGEKLPAGTSAIRFSMGSPYGPSIKIEARAGGRLLTEGSRGNEWVGPTAVAVRPVPTTTSANVTVCVKLGTVTEGTSLSGGKAGHGAPATLNGSPLPGRIAIEYLKPGPRSWAALAASIANHMSLGNASGGGWIVFLLIALMLGVIALASTAIIGDLR